MKRKRLSDPRQQRYESTLPDRKDPTEMLVGPLRAFKPRDLRGLESYKIDTLPEDTWLAVFEGPGYRDVDRCVIKSAAQAVVRMFQTAYPRMDVIWLKYEKLEPKLIPTKQRQSFKTKDWHKQVRGRRVRSEVYAEADRNERKVKPSVQSKRRA